MVAYYIGCKICVALGLGVVVMLCSVCTIHEHNLSLHLLFVRDLEICPFAWQKLTCLSLTCLKEKAFQLTSFCLLVM